MAEQIEGKTRLSIDFNSPGQAAAFASWLRGMEKLGGAEVDVVQMTSRDSAFASQVAHEFIVVPARQEHHGPSIYELVETPEPVAEPVEVAGVGDSILRPPTSAAPW